MTLKANKPFTVGKRLVSIWLWAIWVIQDEQELIFVFMNHERDQQYQWVHGFLNKKLFIQPKPEKITPKFSTFSSSRSKQFSKFHR
ncbi:hypothetical protein [Vibrio parahaemolyticus]|uniref:hypothetical protein n=1 Tax=Vibrio parahaemolyticus TaxID=670 RepID=UPI00226A3188|nr:hypothetical protein [Vibrio parahaemolyticus]MCX8859965.1 hypothetical protein [Vibrio parahaemolyticus]MCX8865129.1 hypothetical protein [Vibrio parahaemolyticus]MCX8870254.1 hypothetical protein [Vibrio parahaemolyticus]MCX8900469.1 hypothetical protein [Vibrio parahaemolyticus]